MSCMVMLASVARMSEAKSGTASPHSRSPRMPLRSMRATRARYCRSRLRMMTTSRCGEYTLLHNSKPESLEEIVKRLVVACFILLAAHVVLTAPASAQSWPNKPVRIVLTFAPGGAADFLARTIADNLTKTFNQQFIVEPRPGAAGAIGVNSVVATPPDGYN